MASIPTLPFTLALPRKNHRFSIAASASPKVPSFDIDRFMHDKAAVVNHALELAVPIASSYKLHEVMRYSLAGGKRLRPILCLAACELSGGEESHGLAAAIAIEMIHAMSHIYSDIAYMPNNVLRRGKRPCHAVYGRRVAVLTCQALLGEAFGIVCNPADYGGSVNPARSVRAVTELARAVGGDHAADLDAAGLDAPVGVDRLEFFHIRKAGVLLEASVVTGAIFGGGSHKQIEQLRQYAKIIGLLYKMADEIVGVKEMRKLGGQNLVTVYKTYPKFMMLGKSKEFIEGLLEEVNEQLAGFDSEKAEPLIQLANYIAYRDE